MVRIQPFAGTANRPFARARSSDLPVAAAKDRNALPAGGDPVHVELRRPDHEVDVLAALVDAVRYFLLDEEWKTCAERDVARGVLVEQCVVEDGAEGADPA